MDRPRCGLCIHWVREELGFGVCPMWPHDNKLPGDRYKSHDWCAQWDDGKGGGYRKLDYLGSWRH